MRGILGLSRKGQVERFRRVFTIRDQPIVYLVNYARPDLISHIPANDLLSASFVESFQKHVGIEFKEMDQRIQAVTADIDSGKIVKINLGFPLIYVRNTSFEADDLPIALSCRHYHADHFSHSIKRELSKN